MEYSKNTELEKALGKRNWGSGSVSVDHPCDYGYVCPTCGNSEMQWSEYNSCVWCEECNKDIPTCLTITNLDNAIDTFIKTVEAVK